MKPLFKTTFVLFLLLFGKAVFAQKKTVNIDSLYSQLQNRSDSPKKADSLIALYKQSIRQKEIRKDILEKALSISKAIYYIKGIGTSYDRMGLTARYEQNYGASIRLHKRALFYFNKSTDTLAKIICLNNLGVTYRKLNLEKEAFKYYFEALKLSEKIGNQKSISIAINGIGNVFLNIEEYDKALYYFKKGLKLEKKRNRFRGQEYGFANIGEVYLHKKMYDSAYYYFDKSLQLSLKKPRKESTAIKYTLFGLLHQKQGNYKTSINYYKKSLPKFKEFKNTRYLSNALINIGINQLALKEFTQAYKNITEGLQKARSIKSKENISLGYKALTRYFEQTKNYKEALKAQKQAFSFHDSIVNITSQKSIISTQIAYETLKKDQKIRRLATEKEQSEENAKKNYWRFIGSILFSFITIGILVFALILSRKNKELALEQKNTELQNYLLQITELKNEKSGNSTLSIEQFYQKFNEFELSKKEIEVLTYISKGLSNVQIAKKMFVSSNTVKTHITHIYSKLDVKNRVQAIRKITT